MAWVKLDDRFWSHPKLVAAGLAARGLDLAGVCWSAAHETDGFIPTASLPAIAAGDHHATRLAAKLVEVGRWTEVSDGWEIHDFLTYNRSHAQSEEKRKQDRERKTAGRSSQVRGPDGRVSVGHAPEARRNPPTGPVDSLRIPPTVAPVPTRPDPLVSRPATDSARAADGRAKPDETQKSLNPKALKLAERMSDAIAASGGKPGAQCLDVATWALEQLDFRFADQVVGECLMRNGKPRTPRYFATALAEQASNTGITMTPYQASTRRR